MILYSTRKPS